MVQVKNAYSKLRFYSLYLLALLKLGETYREKRKEEDSGNSGPCKMLKGSGVPSTYLNQILDASLQDIHGQHLVLSFFQQVLTELLSDASQVQAQSIR